MRHKWKPTNGSKFWSKCQVCGCDREKAQMGATHYYLNGRDYSRAPECIDPKEKARIVEAQIDILESVIHEANFSVTGPKVPDYYELIRGKIRELQEATK